MAAGYGNPTPPAPTRTVTPVPQRRPFSPPSTKPETLQHAVTRMRSQGYSDQQIHGEIERWHPTWTDQQVGSAMGVRVLRPEPATPHAAQVLGSNTQVEAHRQVLKEMAQHPAPLVSENGLGKLSTPTSGPPMPNYTRPMETGQVALPPVDTVSPEQAYKIVNGWGGDPQQIAYLQAKAETYAPPMPQPLYNTAAPAPPMSAQLAPTHSQRFTQELAVVQHLYPWVKDKGQLWQLANERLNFYESHAQNVDPVLAQLATAANPENPSQGLATVKHIQFENQGGVGGAVLHGLTQPIAAALGANLVQKLASGQGIGHNDVLSSLTNLAMFLPVERAANVLRGVQEGIHVVRPISSPARDVLQQAIRDTPGITPADEQHILTVSDAMAHSIAVREGITPSEVYTNTLAHSEYIDQAPHISSFEKAAAQTGAVETGGHEAVPTTHFQTAHRTNFKAAAQKIAQDNNLAKVAPPGIDTPEKLQGLIKELQLRAQEAADFRQWYEKSANAILAYTKGDPQESSKLAALLAIYSPQAEVYSKAKEWNNLDRALNAYKQFKETGQISSDLSISKNTASGDWQTARATRVMQGDISWGGLKTNRFYRNFLQYIDPKAYEQQFGKELFSTQDLWMARAFHYPDDKVSGGSATGEMTGQYKFMHDVTTAVADSLGWTPDQAQAAIWTSIKAEHEGADLAKAGGDFADAMTHQAAREQLKEHMGQGTYLDVLKNIHQWAGRTLPASGKLSTAMRQKAEETLAWWAHHDNSPAALAWRDVIPETRQALHMDPSAYFRESNPLLEAISKAQGRPLSIHAQASFAEDSSRLLDEYGALARDIAKTLPEKEWPAWVRNQLREQAVGPEHPVALPNPPSPLDQANPYEELHQAVKNTLGESGGFTLTPNLRDPHLKGGYAVAIPGHETPVPLDEFTPERVRQFVRENQDALNHPGRFVGGWRDGKQVYLDISEIHPSRDAAIQAGKDNNQKAIYDLAKGEDIPIQFSATHGENPRVLGATAKLDSGKAALFLFKDANTGTALHELAHVFEDHLPQEVRDQIKDPEHFARSFEQYVKNGEAPTPELQHSFEQMAQTLDDVYGAAHNIPGADLTSPLKQSLDNFFMREAKGDPSFAKRVGASWFAQEEHKPPEYTPSRTLAYRDLVVHPRPARSQLSRQVVDRPWDATGVRLEKIASRLRESNNPLAKQAGRALTPFSTRSRVPRIAARNFKEDMGRVMAGAHNAMHTLTRLDTRLGLHAFKPGEGEGIAHYWWAQLPESHRTAEGLQMIRDALMKEHEYVSDPQGAFKDLQDELAALKESRPKGEDVSASDVFAHLSEEAKVKQHIADIPQTVEALQRNIVKLEKLVRKTPQYRPDAIESIRQLMEERTGILMNAGVLDPGVASERTGLMARHLGLEPDGSEIYVGHRPGDLNRGASFPRGASFGGTAAPRGAAKGHQNQLMLFKQGMLQQSMDSIIKDWSAAQGYQFAIRAKNDLAAMGEPVVGYVKRDHVLVNPAGHRVPRAIHTDPEAQAEAEGLNVNDLTELHHNLFAESKPEQERMIEEARKMQSLHDLRQVPKDVVGKYYEEILGKRAAVSTPGVRPDGLGTTLGKAVDTLTNGIYMSLIYTNPGYVPSILMQNMVMAGLHQGAFLPLNLARAGDLLAHGNKEVADFIKGEVGVGALESLAAGKQSNMTHQFIRHIHTIPDTWPRTAAFLHEAARAGIISRFGRLKPKDEAALLDLFKNPAKREQLREIANYARQSQVDFTRLRPTEQALARRLLFVWPWIRGISAWPGRFLLDHPGRSAALAAYIAAGSQGKVPFPKIVTQNVPTWLQESISTGHQDIQGKQYPQVFSTRYLAPWSTPVDLSQTLTGAPGAAVLNSLLNPLLGTLWHIGNKEDQYGHAAKNYRAAFLSGLESLVPNYKLAKDLINPPTLQHSGLYPGDTTRTGRIERALRVFPFAYNPQQALKDSEAQGLQGNLTQQHEKTLTTDAQRAGFGVVPKDILLALDHKTALDHIGSTHKNDPAAALKGAVQYYTKVTGRHDFDRVLKQKLPDQVSQTIYDEIRGILIGPGLGSYESAVKNVLQAKGEKP